MLAELLASSYIPYNEYTTFFPAWLSKKAVIQNRGTEKKKAWKRILTPLQVLAQVRQWPSQAMTDA